MQQTGEGQETVTAQIVLEGPGAGPSDAFELSLGDVLDFCLRNLKTILVVTAIAGFVSLVAAIVVTSRYTAMVKTQVADYDDKGGNVLSGLSGAINLVGGRGNTSTKAVEAMAIIRSRDFAYRFMADQNMLPVLFEDSWDGEKKVWKKRGTNPVDWFKGVLLSLGGNAPKQRGGASDGSPSMWEAYKKYRNIVYVAEERTTPLIVLEVESTSPQLAAKWANALIAQLNTEMRQRAIADSNKRLASLSQRMRTEGIANLRESATALIERELNTIMIASAQDDYALRIIDPAVVPEEPSAPSRAAILFLGTMLGFFASLGVAFLLEMRAKKRSAV